MSDILIGTSRETGQSVYLPLSALARHLHLIGYTGSGKTTAILTILNQIIRNPYYRPCIVILDRLGGFSDDLLHWFSSSWCPGYVRSRLLYIDAAKEELVVPMNPLLYQTQGEGYFRVARATEITLQGWASQDISAMPRLARWMFNSFWAASQLGLTIGDCVHLLQPRSDLHRLLVAALPDDLRWEWDQIFANNAEAERQLESSRNRLRPIFRSNFLRATFSSTRNYLDVRSWMRDRKIVVINLAPKGKLPPEIADMIGGLVVNEVTSVARSLLPQERVETLLVLDEFQNFVGPDLEFSLAESRQLKTSLILSHQSFSQLKREDVDLTSLIFQAQSRLILNVQGFDADLLAGELAGLTYDAKKVKDENWRRCQRISGHRIIELQSWNNAEQEAQTWQKSVGHKWSSRESVARRDGDMDPVRSGGSDHGSQDTEGHGGSATSSRGHGRHETLVPIYEDYMELASRTYSTFDEQKNDWGRKLRKLKQGQAVWRSVDDDRIHELDVERMAPGHLALDWSVVTQRMPQVVEAYERIIEENFSLPCFVSPVLIERETQDRLQAVLHPRIDLRSPASEPAKPPESNDDFS